jgi:prevent-host-death family protein
MPIINIYEAKRRLSQLVDRAASGEDIVIGRGGKPVAKITRLSGDKREIRFGVLKGKLKFRCRRSRESGNPASCNSRFVVK